jgi:hypothetical protein
MDDQIHIPTYFISDIDIAAICNCDGSTASLALMLAASDGKVPRSWSSGVIRRYKRIGKPYEPNFSGYSHEHLWEWRHLPELKRIVDEYIRTHPKSS